MTTPVFTRRTQSQGEKMDMTTPVITKRVRLNIFFIFPYVLRPWGYIYIHTYASE